MECPPNEQRPAAAPDARAEVPAGASQPVRCILALPVSERRTPPDLVEAFAARQIEVRECVGPFDAMTKLILAARDEDRPVAIVVVEPEKFGARAEELLRSAGKYAPRAARWVYSDALSPRLQKWIEPPAPPAPKVNGIREAIREATGQPNLRLTGHPEPQRKTPAPGADSGMDATLTEEELSMLLSDEDFGPADESGGSSEQSPTSPPYDKTKP